MTQSTKFKIGLALNYIAGVVDDENLERIKGRLKEIEEIIVNEPTTEDLRVKGESE